MPLYVEVDLLAEANLQIEERLVDFDLCYQAYG